MNRKFFVHFCLVFFWALKSNNETQLDRKILDIIKNTDPSSSIGIQVYSLNDKKVVYNNNHDKLYLPASTQKLITLAAALHYLGPSYRFETKLLCDSISPNNNIKNIYIKGSGDPSFDHNNLSDLAQEIYQMNIKHIDGNIYIDDQAFDNIYWPKGSMWDDRDRGFAAPVSGLNFDYNRQVIKISPNHFENKKAYAALFPYSEYIKVQINTLTKNGKSDIKYSLDKQQKDNIEGLLFGDKIIFNGQISLKSEPQYFLFAIKDPGLWAGNFLREQLERLGIKTSGKVLKAKTPPNAIFLTKHVSRSLSEALVDFTKISNDVANDSLIKAIALNAKIEPASMNEGLKLVKKFLEGEVKIDTKNLVAADGSGLSRYNLMSPGQLVDLLVYAHNNFLLAPEFIAALPIGGKDGTLRSLFRNNDFLGNIRAKTGKMTGVHNLAGFLNVNDKKYVFAIMVNNFVGSIDKFNKMQEEIFGAILESDKKIVKK